MTEQSLPIVTGAQMAAVDTAMVDVCGLELTQIMETAGRSVAIVARHLWRNCAQLNPVVILCGIGGNGGDGFVCGRHLVGWGIPVELWLMGPSHGMRGLAAHRLNVCRNVGLTLVEPDRVPNFDHAGLIVDGLFGFGLSAAPSGRAAALIEAANVASAPTLSIDIPSGIDATTGTAFAPAIMAKMTVTLGLPKQGLLQDAGPSHAGTVLVADIGIPAAAYAAAGIPTSTAFRNAEFVDLQGKPWRSE